MEGILIYRIACSILSFTLFLWSLLYKKVTNENKVLTIVFSSTFMYNIGLIWEIYCTNIESAYQVQRYNSLFLWCTLVGMYLFSARYTSTKVPRHAFIFYALMSLITNTAMSTAMNHTLFFSEVSLDESGLYNKLDYKLEILGHMFNLLLLLLCLFSLLFAIQYYRKPSRYEVERARKKTLLFSMCIPCLSLCLSKIIPQLHNDIILGGSLISSIILFYAAYHYKIFDVGNSAKEQMLDTMSQAMIITDRAFGFIYANEAAKRMFPECSNALEGTSLWELFQRLGTRELEVDGRIYEVNTKAVYEEHELGGFSTCLFDVTERRNYEQQLIAKKNEADQANQAKSTFLAMVSHEIRTPLNTVIGLSEIALRAPMKKELNYQIKSIRHAARGLLYIINSILDISKLESGKIEVNNEPYYLKDLLYEVSHMTMMDLAGSKTEYVLYVDPTIPNHLTGDYAKIRQILNNLLANSVKYTKEGKIMVSLSSKQQDGQVELGFTISDSGIGIPKDSMKTIFDSYVRVNDSSNRNVVGTGLGLHIVSQYVTMMDGTISVTSECGKGTSFFIKIPQEILNQDCIGEIHITSDEMSTFLDEDYIDVTKGITFEGAHILLVDDMEINLEVTKGLLAPYRMNIDQATSANGAIRKVQENTYDLVFMDHMMPVKDGIQAVKEIRSLKNEKAMSLPIIMLTANAIEGVKEKVIQKGFQDYLSKPVDQRKLREILEKWLSGYLKYEPIGQIDFDNGLRNVGNHLEQYTKVLSAYENEMKTLLRRLPEMVRGDANELRVKIHGIKGGSRSIGATELGDYAAMIEEKLKQNDFNGLEDSIQNLMDMLEQLLKNIHGYLFKSREIKEVVPDDLKKTDIDAAWWTRLYDMVTRYDSIQALKLVSEAMPAEENETKQLLKELVSYLETMEYEQCKEKINFKLLTIKNE